MGFPHYNLTQKFYTWVPSLRNFMFSMGGGGSPKELALRSPLRPIFLIWTEYLNKPSPVPLNNNATDHHFNSNQSEINEINQWNYFAQLEQQIAKDMWLNYFPYQLNCQKFELFQHYIILHWAYPNQTTISTMIQLSCLACGRIINAQSFSNTFLKQTMIHMYL